jgi:putative tryptophan/tyrosine transport system substrate-binding protein
MMQRRTFVAGVAAVMVAPFGADAQELRTYRLGVILQGGTYSQAVNGLQEGLRELGFEERKQFILHMRDARDLERQNVDLIYAVATSVAVVVKRATKNVPIVFYAGTDPVASGLVENFRKPDGRLTGTHSQFADLGAKRLELLKEMVPNLRRIATFYSPDNPVYQHNAKLARDAARRLKVELVEWRIASVEELRSGLRALRPEEADALLVIDAVMVSQSELIIETARAKGLPTMFPEGGLVAKGGLASYGVSYHAAGRLSAKQVQRILLGAAPGDLPVEQVDRFHFAINLKTARALNLTIPPALLLRADQVIE